MAMCANRPRLAHETLAGDSLVVSDSPTQTAWSRGSHADAYHVLGQYSEELDLTRKARQEFPTMVGFYAKEARALIGLARLADAERAVAGSLEVQRQSAPPAGTEFTSFEQIDPGQAMCLVSMEFGAHGHAQEALATARRAVEWFEARPASEKQALFHRWLLAMAKYLAEDWDGARALYAPLSSLTRPIRPAGWSDEAAYPLAVRFRGRLGVIAARQGDRLEAERIAHELEQVERPYLFGEHLYQRAAIAAQLGDKAKAMNLLREAVAQGFGATLDYYGYPECLHRAPEMGPLRGYPPFEELLKPKG